KGYEVGAMSGRLAEWAMPIKSGAVQRPSGCRCGNTLRQRYDEVGLPCNSTMGSPCPTSTYAISRPRTRRRFFWYGNAAEIMFVSPAVDQERLLLPIGAGFCATTELNRWRSTSSWSQAGGRSRAQSGGAGNVAVRASAGLSGHGTQWSPITISQI